VLRLFEAGIPWRHERQRDRDLWSHSRAISTVTEEREYDALLTHSRTAALCFRIWMLYDGRRHVDPVVWRVLGVEIWSSVGHGWYAGFKLWMLAERNIGRKN
jgi:hypothetical protein